jgi:DNA-binding FadR family transcriptional regulator
MKQQLVDQVIEHLKSVIASGKYGIGAKLPAEHQLVEELGVGRSTLREAIRVLAYNGMLEVRQGDGTYVRALPADGEPLANRLRRARVGEIQEVRQALELEIVKLAAKRYRKKDLQQMRRHLKERHEALIQKDIPAVLDADISFHCAVAEASGNKVLADLYRTFELSLRGALETLWEGADSNPKVTEELHYRLVEAIAARDAAQAVTAASALLNRHSKSLSAALP